MSQKQLYQVGPYRIDVGLSRLERAGRAIALPPKAFDLLLLLAHNHHRVMSKAELMEALWPKTFVEDANLTQHVYTLRKTLGDQPNGEPYIELVTRRGYRLVGDVQHVDLEEKPSVASLKSVSADAGPAVEASAIILESERKPVTVLHCSLTNAAGIVEILGPERLNEIMRHLLALAADEVGRYDGVISERHTDGFAAVFGAPAVHEDDAGRAILAALALQNRFRHATEAYESQTLRLDLRMGVNSGLLVISRVGDQRQVRYSAVGETMRKADLLQQFAEPDSILISEASRRAVEKFVKLDSVEVPPPIGPRAYRVVGPVHSASPQPMPSRAAFIGRQREIAVLQGLLADMLASKGQVVSIVGEAGIGKSRLVDEFARPPSGHGQFPRILVGRCVSFGSLIPYLPIADLFRQFCDVAETDSPEIMRQAIGRAIRESGLPPETGAWLLPLVGIVDAPVVEGLSPEAVKASTFDVLQRLLLKAAAYQPLIIIIEDVHWIDHTSEEFLTAFVARLAGSRSMLLTTHRPEYRASWMNRSYATQVTLSPLTSSESTRLVRSVAGEDALNPDVARVILSRGEGNPFFLEELARNVTEHNSATDAIPATVHGVIMARIDRLAERPKQLLQTGSVLGREVPLKLLRLVWNGPPSFDADLVELCRLEFLYERPPGNEAEPTYQFKHALTQDVAYDSLLTRKRGELHLRAASAVRTLFADRLDEATGTLAYHYARTDLIDEAVLWLTRAADQAARVYANAEALLHLNLAARRLQRLPEGADRDRRMLEVAQRQAHSLYFLGLFRESVDILLPHGARVARLQDRALAATYAFWLAHMYSRLGDQESAGDLARRAIDAAIAAGDQATLGKAHGVLALESHWAGKPHAGIDHGIQSARLLAHQPDQRWWLGMAHFYVAINFLLQGDFRATLAEASRAEAVGEEIGDPRLRTYAGYVAGWAEASRGHHDAAIERCRRSLEQAPDRVSRAYASLFLGFALLEKGEHVEARALLEPMVSELEAFGLPQWHALAAMLTGEALRLDKRIDEASVFVERGLQAATRAGYTYAVAFGQRIGGRLSRDRGCAGDGLCLCQRALETFEASGALFEAARTRLDLAQMAFEATDVSRACRELTAAAEAFDAVGEKTYRDRTVTLAARFGLERAVPDCWKGGAGDIRGE